MIGKKVALRAVEPKDVDLLYNWENDQKIWQLSSTVTPFSRFVLEQYVMNATQDIYSAKQLRLMVECIEDNKPRTVGAVDLFDFDPTHQRAGVGILIAESERGKGYAVESLGLLIDYAFNTLNMHQLYCNISEDNAESLSLFRKMGFTVSGEKKDWLQIKNQWFKEIFLQLINREE